MLRAIVIRNIIIQQAWHASASEKGDFLLIIFCLFGINLNKTSSEPLYHFTTDYL